MSKNINLAIFASGTGSNARKIVEYFDNSDKVEVKLIASNKRSAKVLELCAEYGISKLSFNREHFYDSKSVSSILDVENIDYIILAGFLWKFPSYLIKQFPDRILNIHPALLPKYGGAGMYGANVHKAVVAAKEKESGPTIHLVNENYDEGRIIFQASTPISNTDSPEQVASKVLALEHLHYPQVIAEYCNAKK